MNALSLRLVAQRAFCAFCALCLVLSGWEILQQSADTGFVRSESARILREARASSPREKVLALRNYLRKHVTYVNVSQKGRPFLRSSASETLRSGEGYCGEVTRAFICLADAAGVRAQRINLFGLRPHVVAEAELGPHDRVVVDCQNPPMIPDLESLDQVIQRPDWDDYSTLNVRRLRLSWLFSRTKVQMGPVTFWSENPHALKAAFWLSILAVALAGLALRRSVRWYLRKRGWVHRSELRSVSIAAAKR